MAAGLIAIIPRSSDFAGLDPGKTRATAPSCWNCDSTERDLMRDRARAAVDRSFVRRRKAGRLSRRTKPWAAADRSRGRVKSRSVKSQSTGDARHSREG
jgi:hypothetical protein